SAARHPYARQLLAAIPTYGKRGKRLTTVQGKSAAPQEDTTLANADAGARHDIPAPHAARSGAPASEGGAGRAVHAVPQEAPPMGDPVLSVRNLCVSYRARGGLFNFNKTGVDVVKELSLDLHAGETL